MTDQALKDEMRSGVNVVLRHALDHPLLQPVPELKVMLEYQMGMDDAPGSGSAQGKRLRPLLLLLSNHAVGGDWRKALSAAAAVELMHNFSLIHDDIEDKSEMRRGRPTVWAKWGTPQAINVGDAMLGLAQLTLLQESELLHEQSAVELFRLFNQTLVRLTSGQYLDLAFERAADIGLEDYDRMAAGKTGALLAACFEMGAVLGDADPTTRQRMAETGRAAGRAFQIQDDWLGIWGSEKYTGKSIHSDLVERKKTFPVILGIQNGGQFASLWNQLEVVNQEDAERLARVLEKEGVRDATASVFNAEYVLALELMKGLDLPVKRVEPLLNLFTSILNRIR